MEPTTLLIISVAIVALGVFIYSVAGVTKKVNTDVSTGEILDALELDEERF